ncbi:hypothetical protein DPMN_057825 [Dreissena polymorpha]|uniref:Uncharacterized protein n=1 Tax=Dreissena polymorpha TaxID=45954 RepID=A0A9D4C0V1_DREPO|nr:hypothetical protein DPMN_057825 [Dreissena polymorpha]
MGTFNRCLPGFMRSKKNKHFPSNVSLRWKRKICCPRKESPTKKSTRHFPKEGSLRLKEKTEEMMHLLM